MSRQNNLSEQWKPDFESKIKEWFANADEKQKKKFINLWDQLDYVDEVYYQYCQNGDDRYQYYMDRYQANKKFQDKIESIFEVSIYDIDAKSILDMWQLLDAEEDPEHTSSGKVKERLIHWQKQGIQKKLQKYAKEDVLITEENVKEYLQLLEGQKKRQKQILEAENQVPAELLLYFDEHRNDMDDMKNRCLVLSYCIGRLQSFGWKKEETKYWENLMIYAATQQSGTALTEIRDFIKRE